jgi:hypothetical protein
LECLLWVQKAKYSLRADVFCFASNNGHRSTPPPSPFCADIVAKAFLGGRTKIFRAADAFCARRREGPYRFIQNRPATFVVVLKSDTAAEKSKDQLSRDFPGRSIFDFCNNICQKQKHPTTLGQPRLPKMHEMNGALAHIVKVIDGNRFD